MKTNTQIISTIARAAVLFAGLALPAALLAQPQGTEDVLIHNELKARPPLKDVTFLGVSTHGIDAALAAQMNLPPETGLVVVNIMPGSPAAGVLKEHDLLTRFDDQILIEPRQLGVLVRSRKEGDEVKFTLFRAGKPETISVKLGKRAMPPLPQPFVPGTRQKLRLDEDGAGLFSRPLTRGFVTRNPGEMRVSLFEPKDAVMVFDDGSGALEVQFKDGKKQLTAKNPKGDVLFSGPIETAEERKALPADVKTRLEKMEAMDVRVPVPPKPPGVPSKLRATPGAALPTSEHFDVEGPEPFMRPLRAPVDDAV
jgi:serine protease Do